MRGSEFVFDSVDSLHYKLFFLSRNCHVLQTSAANNKKIKTQ